ncbi:multidrug ABC transporter permease [Neobacillus notoginsengisoli]|uniref:Multidrug ABC transporter permease n=1 Tax=Neobacillus notoginsengisoli TaxID=1578198 RepID=A0A417YS26_9BACI|nr:DUF6449 domain-containing protein [Neobacillus notoginsengisoli]RHW38098.1 multidrug ABC transporter permease [Neobacillus notoginsengisoli]
MPSRMSLFNRDLFLQIGRNVGWISIVYFLGLLFVLPIRMMMMMDSESAYTEWTPYTHLFQYDFAIQFILLIAAPVLLSVFLFRFLQVRQWVDLMHSLPVGRERIFHFYTLSGIVFLLLPIILIAVILMFLHNVTGWSNFYSYEDIWVWTGITAVFNLVIYFAGVFVAMVTGISVVQAVLTYIFLLFPAGISVLLTYNLGMLLYGFPSSYYQIRKLELMSPITHFTFLESPDGKIGWKSLLLYLAISAILYVLALLIYKKRKTEAASEAIAFGSLRAIFKFGVTVCTMMVGGLYFGEYQRTFGWLVFGYAFGTVLGYFVAEMVLQKTWRVFSLLNLRSFAVYSGIIVLLLTGVQSLGAYEKYVPVQDEIKSVTLANYIYSSPEENALYTADPLKSSEAVESVRKLHAEIIVNEKGNKRDLRNTQSFYFIYEKTDGKKTVREYRINQLAYEKWLRPIYMSNEYKHATNPLFKIKDDSVRRISIRDGVDIGKSVVIADQTEIRDAMEILKREVENETYEEWKSPIGTSTTIEIMSKADQFNLELKSSYMEFRGWLKEKGLLEQATIMPKDINYILVSKNFADTADWRDKGDPEEWLIRPLEKDSETLKIKNKEQIQAALDQAGYDWYQGGDYMALFVYKQSNTKEIRTFSEKNAPGFIKTHFAK